VSLVTVYPKLSACGSNQEVVGETWQSFEPFCSLKWCSNYKRKLPFLRGNRLTRSPDWISCQTNDVMAILTIYLLVILASTIWAERLQFAGF